MKPNIAPSVVSPLVVAIALLGAISPMVVAGDRHAQSSTADAPAVNLSAIFSSDDGASMGRYIPLDPVTLADREGAEPLRLGAPTWQSVVSADGSTLVGIKGGQAPGIVVWDARTGEQRGHFAPPAVPLNPLLSHDGSRLVVGGVVCCGTPQHPFWQVFNMTDGSLIAEVEANEPDVWAVMPADIPPVLIDPEGRNLYRLVVPSADEPNGPRPVTLVAYDLTTGEERGRVALPEVLGGWWYTERVVQGARVEDHLTPGFALSPDGQTIAVVHADTQAVTRIDAASLAVVETIVPHPETSRLDRFLGLLSLAPRSATAKRGVAGPTIHAIFAADGRDLYLFGAERAVSENGLLDQRGLGLMRVDLDSGTIEEEALYSEIVTDVIPAPDGETLYVIGPGFTLRRFNAETLSVEAHRAFTTYTEIFVAPA